MTREEAREFLLSIANQLGCIGVENLTDRDGERMRDAIQALEEPQWIPCSEELPEKNGVYLVCYEDVTVPLDWFNGKWFFYKSNPAVEETGTIIAWMQMPEPWKEGDVE